MGSIDDYFSILKDEIEAVEILPGDKPKRSVGDNDTLIDELPIDLRKLYVLKERINSAYEKVSTERSSVLWKAVAHPEDKKLTSSFWQLNEIAFPLSFKKEMLHGLFELVLRQQFAPYAGYALDVCMGWNVVMRGED